MGSDMIKSKNFYYPPGGILIWIVVFIELITFMMGMGAFVVKRSQNTSEFHESQKLLSPVFGLINTILLVTAGYFMAIAVQKLRRGENDSSVKRMGLSILFGLSFMGLKGYEYYDKIVHGFGLEHSDFFMYYWLLTGFHFVHVLAGIVILTTLLFYVKKGYYSMKNHEDVETGGVFWHMCDLIWLILFPILYLL